MQVYPITFYRKWIWHGQTERKREIRWGGRSGSGTMRRARWSDWAGQGLCVSDIKSQCQHTWTTDWVETQQMRTCAEHTHTHKYKQPFKSLCLWALFLLTQHEMTFRELLTGTAGTCCNFIRDWSRIHPSWHTKAESSSPHAIFMILLDISVD